MSCTKGEANEEALYHTQQSFPCGCEVRHYRDESYRITYCPVHKTAPEMYEALKALRHTVDKLIQDGTIPLNRPDIVKITMQSNEALWAMNKALARIK